MKKISFFFTLGFFALSFNSFSQIKVNSSGYVGINQSSPAYNLDWFGTGRFWTTWGTLIFDSSGHGGVAVIYPGDDWNGALGRYDKRFNTIFAHLVNTNYLEVISDETIKENIVDIENSLDKLMKLRGVRYGFKENYFNVEDPVLKRKLKKQGENQLGFIAQELKEVFPELVSFDTTSNLHSVKYLRLIPVLVEAIKEQQVQIEELRDQIWDCCQKKDTKSASINTGIETDMTANIARLDQNSPNPFSKKTIIGCFIPESSLSATIYIFNMQGTQLQEFQIRGTGNSSVVIDDNSLTPGIYLYSLVVDNKEIDTKKMILTK